MGELKTFGAGAPFRVQGSTAEGTLIFYDDTGYVHLPAATYRAMAEQLAGRALSMEELRAWLQQATGLKRHIAPHVAAIAVEAGLATVEGDRLRFPAP